jgi:diguanylate cyclase (GGDEF)-like protein
MFQRAFLLLLLLLAGFAIPIAYADEVVLRGSWMPAIADPSVSQLPVSADDPAWRRFDPVVANTFPRRPHGAWVRLDVEGQWPKGPLVLSIASSPYGDFTLLFPDGSPAQRTSLLDLGSEHWHGHGRIAFELAPVMMSRPFLLLRLEPERRAASGVTFEVQPMAGFLRDDAAWLAFTSACLAILAGMSLMALCFGTLLRDPAFFFYAGYVLCYALIQLVQTGYAAHPLGLAVIAENPRLWGLSGLILSVLFASLFVDRFVNLSRYAPRLRLAIFTIAAAIFVNSVLAVLPFHLTQDLARALINPLLMIMGPLLLAAGVLAFLRGSRYATYFLIGWTPLLVLTVLSSTQSLGVLRDWTELNDLCVAAAAFEAIVLSLGLADRALAMRRDRERISILAETDPLTAVLNRRAWVERVQAMLASVGSETPLSMLFIDLDSFKRLNDTRGHEAGDHALLSFAGLMRSVLRAEDVIGRYGGEEFVAALPDCTGAAATQIAERLRVTLEQEAIALGVGTGVLTTCIGVAERAAGEELSSLVARADVAMYLAKSAGRNRVVFADADRSLDLRA